MTATDYVALATCHVCADPGACEEGCDCPDCSILFDYKFPTHKRWNAWRDYQALTPLIRVLREREVEHNIFRTGGEEPHLGLVLTNDDSVDVRVHGDRFLVTAYVTTHRANRDHPAEYDEIAYGESTDPAEAADLIESAIGYVEEYAR